MKKISKEWLVLTVIVFLTLGIGILEWNKIQAKNTSDGVLSTPPRWRNQNNEDRGINRLEKEEGNVDGSQSKILPEYRNVNLTLPVFKEEMKYLSVKSVFGSLAGTAGLLLFYFLTMRILAGSWEAAVSQFRKLWHFMIPLALGFGIQIGLYINLKKIMKNNLLSKRLMATNTTTSTLGMVACCVHHLTDVLPIIGLSAVSIFLVKFQTPLLILGIVSNIFAILYLLKLYNTKMKGGFI